MIHKDQDIHPLRKYLLSTRSFGLVFYIISFPNHPGIYSADYEMSIEDVKKNLSRARNIIEGLTGNTILNQLAHGYDNSFSNEKV